MSNKILSGLMKLASECERRGQDDLSYSATAIAREVRANLQRQRHAAKGDQIEIESWPDFLNWWNNNRGQNLAYIFIDTYGADSEQVKMVKKLISSAEKHERELHEFYMKLRDMAANRIDPEGNSDMSTEEGQDSPDPSDATDPSLSEEDALDNIALELDS